MNCGTHFSVIVYLARQNVYLSKPAESDFLNGYNETTMITLRVEVQTFSVLFVLPDFGEAKEMICGNWLNSKN